MPTTGAVDVETTVVPSTRAGLRRCADALVAGELVAFATETVYGLGADARSHAAVKAVYAAKGRPGTDPLIVHVADVESASALGDLEAGAGHAAVLVDAFWPGPLTVVVPRKGGLASEVSGGSTVGLRCPAHPDALELIRLAGLPVAAPSANRFGRVSPTAPAHVIEELGGRIGWVLDSGPTPLGVESTVVQCVGDTARLLRPGGVSVEDLVAVIGRESLSVPDAVVTREDTAAESPGTSISHYAPNTPIVLTDGGDVVASEISSALVNRGLSVRRLVLPEGDGAARELYSRLRELDESTVGAAHDVALAVTVDPAGLGRAVNDRLFRAAHGHIAADASERTIELITRQLGE
ncbi:MAG: L-threonylcarbamoyladenylate synthase [Microthrixaceae bacterium]